MFHNMPLAKNHLRGYWSMARGEDSPYASGGGSSSSRHGACGKARSARAGYLSHMPLPSVSSYIRTFIFLSIAALDFADFLSFE